MKLDEYQTGARSTAIYPDKLYYPTLGLVGELGELITAVRSDPLEIPKELADCLWYVANLAADADLTLSEVCNRQNFPTKWHASCYSWTYNELAELWIAMGQIGESVKKTIRDNDSVLTDTRRAVIKKALREVMLNLTCFAIDNMVVLEQCAIENLEKLRSRQERGVIKGDGNAR